MQTTSFVLHNHHITGYKGTYVRLVSPITQQGKEDMFLTGENRYTTQQDNFAKIPGAPVAYWLSDAFADVFQKGMVSAYGETRKGMFTGNNDLWLKLWFEIPYEKMYKKFFPYSKGGGFRRWYGNNDYVVNWDNDGNDIISYKGSGNINPGQYFMRCITWNLITTSKPGFRIIDDSKHVMGDGGPTVVFKGKDMPIMHWAL